MNKFLFVLAVYSAGLSVVGNYVNVNVPDPYMDEIFHIPQAQKYCVGNFTEWDPKLTTLPGLYLISVGIVSPLNTITTLFSGEKPELGSCTTVHLSLNVSLLPVLFFFNFLYYTDTVSTTMVLLMYSLYISDKYGLSSLAGLLSVLCRQTNIVWVFFMAGLAGGQILAEQIRLHQAKTQHPPTLALTTSGQILELIDGTWTMATKNTTQFFTIIGLIVTKCFGFILVGISFLLFVKLNNGIVVGDRSAHVAVVHLPQILYFSLYCCGLTSPFLFNYITSFLSFVQKNLISIIFIGILLSVIIYYNTLAHPYLLADNRHFTFYIWRRFFMRHWSLKFVLVPAYILGAYCIANIVQKSELMFRILFPICLVLSLAPQENKAIFLLTEKLYVDLALLEFRYYIIPFILVRLQIKPSSLTKLAIEFLVLVAINAVTLYLFLFKPFTWEHEPKQLQRFMW